MTNMGKGETMAVLDDFDWKKLCSCWERWHRGESREPLFNIAVTPPAGSVKCPHHYLSMYDFSIPAAEILDEIETYAEQCAYFGGAYPSAWLNFGPGVLAAMVGGEVYDAQRELPFSAAASPAERIPGIAESWPPDQPLHEQKWRYAAVVPPPGGSGRRSGFRRARSRGPCRCGRWRRKDFTRFRSIWPM